MCDWQVLIVVMCLPAPVTLLVIETVAVPVLIFVRVCVCLPACLRLYACVLVRMHVYNDKRVYVGHTHSGATMVVV